MRLHGRTLKNLRTGVTFRAIINRISDNVLVSELGPDPRGQIQMQIAKSNAPDLVAMDQLTDLGNNEKWRVLSTAFDCPEYALKFDLNQITAQDT